MNLSGQLCLHSHFRRVESQQCGHQRNEDLPWPGPELQKLQWIMGSQIITRSEGCEGEQTYSYNHISIYIYIIHSYHFTSDTWLEILRSFLFFFPFFRFFQFLSFSFLFFPFLSFLFLSFFLFFLFFVFSFFSFLFFPFLSFSFLSVPFFFLLFAFLFFIFFISLFMSFLSI